MTIDRIEPAAVGVTALLGHSSLGPLGRFEECLTESDFNRHFGDYEEGEWLAAGVHGFFQNGGRRCLVQNLGAEGRPLQRADLEPLRERPEIELVCAPGKVSAQDHEVLVRFCEEVGTLFCVLDGPFDLEKELARLRPNETRNAAYYVPWLQAHHPVRRELAAFPPSGHLAGLMARVASERGMHKAPANEAVRGVSGLAHEITRAEQDILHPRRINCIRELPKIGGVRPWGAQTLASVAPFRTISAFRTWSYVVRSFRTGCDWITGEVNGPDLWQRLTTAGNEFLTELWRTGGLAGVTAELAYRFRCDADTNPGRQRDSSLVKMEIGLALVQPNVFYTFQLGLDTSGA